MKYFEKFSFLPVLLLAGLIATGSVAHAQDNALASLVELGDVDAVERHVQALHVSHLEGDTLADDLRSAFASFGRTAPQTTAFVESWLASYPNSPYAHAAMGWNLQNRAWRYRGSDQYRYTWPPAVDAFETHLLMSQHHAEKALKLDPYLLSASDLVIVNEPMLGTLGADGVLGLVDQVMAKTPNRGTLLRVARAFDPRWGKSVSHIGDLCEKHSQSVPESVYKTPLHCAADLTLTIDPSQNLRDRAIATLSADGWTGYETHQYRLYQTIFTRHLAELTSRDVVAYLETDGANDFRTLQAFYETEVLNLALTGNEEMEEKAKQLVLKSRNAALASLSSDPGNHKLVKAALYQIGKKLPSKQFIHPEDRLALWGPVLNAAPFDASLWDEASDAGYQFNLEFSKALENYKLIKPLQINAVAYSNHRPAYLKDALTRTAMTYDAHLSRMSSSGPELADIIRTGLDEHMLCPIIRQSRLFDVVCDASPNDYSCNVGDGYRTSIVEKAKTYADDKGLCAFEGHADIAEIVYYPVSVTVGTFRHHPDPMPR